MVTFQCSVVRAPQESVSINSPGQWLLTVAIHSPHPGLTDSEYQRGGVECSECVLHLHGSSHGPRDGNPCSTPPCVPREQATGPIQSNKEAKDLGPGGDSSTPLQL